MKYVWLTIIFNYFVLPASVGVSYVASQFHVSNSDGQMSKGAKTSQRCEWFIVTSRNVSSKINVKPFKVQIPIIFLILWIFWSNKNEFTLHIITCLKITESQNGQIYPEDTFSHGTAHMKPEIHIFSGLTSASSSSDSEELSSESTFIAGPPYLSFTEKKWKLA